VTIYMNLRQASVGGGVKNPSFLEGDGTAAVTSVRALDEDRLVDRVANCDVLFATHGFNVNYAAGMCALGRLENALSLPSTCRFIGILWPGDFWIPVVNYPFEGDVAIDCGRRVALFCHRRLNAAASLSFATHSLGARLALEAARTLTRRVRSICLTAPAVNNDCLSSEYAAAFSNTDVVSVLASRRDKVLRLAYPVGDAIADFLHPDHVPLAAALGLAGPPHAIGATAPPWQISDGDDYDHGDYLPPSNPATPYPDAGGKWARPVGFMQRAFNGERQTWP
jgi:hypothetical protein